MFKHLSAFCLVLTALSACSADNGDQVTGAAGLASSIEDSGSIARGEWREYGPFEVTDGGTFTANLYLTSGDADLYVRSGQEPTSSSFDCRPYLGGSQDEECVVAGPATVYVAVDGYGWNTDFELSISNTGGTEPVCGDNEVAGDEQCDSDTARCFDLDNGQWLSGTATCATDCTGYDTSACIAHPVCGNDIVEINEQCDQSEPRECASLSSKFGAGLAYCDACIGWNEDDCVLDARDTCGNATVDSGEVCDGTPIACSELNPDWKWGEAPCSSDCSGWDETACNLSHPEQFTETGTVTAGRWHHLGPYTTTDGEFKAVMTGTGDADLYVRRGRPATAGVFDCRSNGSTSSDSCTLQGSAVYYVSVYGYAATSDFSVTVDTMFKYTTPYVRVNRGQGTVGAGEWQYFGPYAHGEGVVHVVLSGTNDADLYVKHGSKPTEDSWDCRPYASSSHEFCDLGDTGRGELWVGIRGYSSSSEFETMSVWLQTDR